MKKTSSDEIDEIMGWVLYQLESEEISLPQASLPFVTHTQKVTLRDLYRLSGKIHFSSGKVEGSPA